MHNSTASIDFAKSGCAGCLIAMGRVNRPSLMVYGGTIRAGCSSSGEQLDIVSAFQSYGSAIACPLPARGTATPSAPSRCVPLLRTHRCGPSPSPLHRNGARALVATRCGIRGGPYRREAALRHGPKVVPWTRRVLSPVQRHALVELARPSRANSLQSLRECLVVVIYA